jgi:hypothetical protein
VTPEAEQILFDSGILSVPDFIANCGGVIGASMKRAGISNKYIDIYINNMLGNQIDRVLKASSSRSIIPAVLAQSVAERRFARVKQEAERKGLLGRSFKIGLELYRKGIVPQLLVKPVAPWYFERKIRHVDHTDQTSSSR